jgi:hypothetical protein
MSPYGLFSESRSKFITEMQPDRLPEVAADQKDELLKVASIFDDFGLSDACSIPKIQMPGKKSVSNSGVSIYLQE